MKLSTIQLMMVKFDEIPTTMGIFENGRKPSGATDFDGSEKEPGLVRSRAILVAGGDARDKTTFFRQQR